jgi:hypothetical protein
MSTINSAIHGLLSGRNNTASRMRRVSLGILIYLIWEERNKRVFDNSCNPVPFFFTDSRFYFTWFYTFMNSFLAAGVFWLGKLVCMAVMHPFGVWLCYLSYFDAVANSFFFFILVAALVILAVYIFLWYMLGSAPYPWLGSSSNHCQLTGSGSMFSFFFF